MNDTALRHFLDDYCAAFRPGNIAAIAKLYHLPVTMMVGEQISTLNNEQRVMDMLEAIVRSLVARGFDHSRVDDCYIHPLTSNSALISATFSRLKTDGTVLEQLGATYTVVNTDDGYRIAVLVAHDVGHVIKN